MKCEKCKKNEANIKYTQIVNGIKEELNLCEKCAHGLGFENVNFTMPIDFSDFFGEFLENDNTNVFPEVNLNKGDVCSKCGMDFDEFASIGKFGCDNCYKVFSNKIDRILRGVHGTDTHVGRKFLKRNEENISNETNTETKQDSTAIKIEELKNKLKQLIKEENYEEAAKVRDEIKKWEGGK